MKHGALCTESSDQVFPSDPMRPRSARAHGLAQNATSCSEKKPSEDAHSLNPADALEGDDVPGMIGAHAAADQQGESQPQGVEKAVASTRRVRPSPPKAPPKEAPVVFTEMELLKMMWKPRSTEAQDASVAGSGADPLVAFSQRGFVDTLKQKVKIDTVSKLLFRPTAFARFGDWAKGKLHQMTSTSRAVHSLDQLDGAGPVDTRFSRQRSDLARFVEAFSASMHMIRK